MENALIYINLNKDKIGNEEVIHSFSCTITNEILFNFFDFENFRI